MILIKQSSNVTMESAKQERPVSERVIPALSQVYTLHDDLQKTINEMDVKIQEVIRCHEAEFLLAYRNHIKKIKHELYEIKQRSEEQEKKMLSNQRSVILQKQIILFREEALRLYDKLDALSEQHETTKTSCRQLEKVNAVLEKQNKEQARQIKILQAEKTILEGQMESLASEIKQIKEEMSFAKEKKLKVKLSQGQTSNTNININFQIQSKKFRTPKPRDSFNLPLPLNTRKGTLQEGRKEFASNNSGFMRERRTLSKQLMDHELKNWFVECLQTIRKEVAQRKAYGYKSEEIQSIASWEEFRMIDKLRLLEMFMQNQKLLVLMYQKIFPTRLNELQNYFAQKKEIGGESRQKSKSMNIQLGDIELPTDLAQQATVREEIALPRVARVRREKKYDVRGRIQLKHGKLQLSQNTELT